MSRNKIIFYKNKRGQQTNFENSSKIRQNREYLLSPETAQEMNTYVSFEPFYPVGDLFEINNNFSALADPKASKASKKAIMEQKMKTAKAVRSIFNKKAAVTLAKSNSIYEASEWRLSNNIPLIDTRQSRKIIKETSNCSVKNLVYASQHGLLGNETYDYSDFMYCKYLGKISNNYMVTLRRFPFPVSDNISKVGVSDSTLKDKNLNDGNASNVGCLVTWMGTPGNDMANILKWSVAMPFKEQTQKWENASGGGGGGGGFLNQMAAAFDTKYMQQAMAGQAPIPFNGFLNKITGGVMGDNPYSVSDLSGQVDNNKTYGPVDAVKTTYLRDGDKGLTFDQNITLTFDYQLKAYGGINTRQAMLDLIGNILAVTYTTGNWWKGGYRGGGAHQNNIFSHLKTFQCKGGFNDFVDAFAEDYTTITEEFRNNLKAKTVGNKGGADKGNTGWAWLDQALSVLKSAANSIGGMILGGMLNKLGRPAKGFANSLLSGAPVGFWHVTVGNPFHPIMSMGNMILKNTTIEHYGPLGLDDFPTGLKVTCELTRGKARDLRSIESLYTHGLERIYTPMSDKIRQIYMNSKEYRANVQTADKESNNESDKIKTSLGDKNVNIKDIDDAKKESIENNKNIGPDIQEQINSFAKAGVTITPEELENAKAVLMKYFGTDDVFSVFISSKEQDYGAQKKKEKEESENNQAESKSN